MYKRDKFFEQDYCDRCGGSLDCGRTMSMFNTDCLCMDCVEAERKERDYRRAVMEEMKEIRRGNYNFEGIGRGGDK